MAEPGASMISRVVRILEAFEIGDRSLSISDIARRTTLPLPTTHRIVTELIAEKVLERDDSRQIRIGMRLWELASRSSVAMSIRDLALPFMEDLQSVAQEHTQLSVLDGNSMLYLESISSRRSKSVNVVPPGGRLPVLACSAGIVLTAFSPPELQEHLLQTRITQFTDETLSQREEIRHLVAESRRDGYAFAPAWIDETTAGIAVPILDSEGVALASLSIVLPRASADARMLLPALRTAAVGISRAIRTSESASNSHASIIRLRIRRSFAHTDV